MSNLKLISAMAMSLKPDEKRQLEQSLMRGKKVAVRVYDLDSMVPPDADPEDVLHVFNAMIHGALISSGAQSKSKFLSREGDIDPAASLTDSETGAPMSPENVAEKVASEVANFSPVVQSDQPVIIPGITAPVVAEQVLASAPQEEAVKDVALKAAVAVPPVSSTETVVLEAVNAAPSETAVPVSTSKVEVIMDSDASAAALAAVAMRDAVAKAPMLGIPALADSQTALDTISSRVSQEFNVPKHVVADLLKLPIMDNDTFNAIASKPSQAMISRFAIAQGDIVKKRDSVNRRCIIHHGSTSPIIAMPMTRLSNIKHAPANIGRMPFIVKKGDPQFAIKIKKVNGNFIDPKTMRAKYAETQGEGDLGSILGSIGGFFIKDISNATADIIRKKANPTPAESRRLRDYDRMAKASKQKEDALLKDLNSEANSMDAEELGKLANRIVELRKEANGREYELSAKENVQPKLLYTEDDLDPYKIHPVMVARIEDIKKAYAGSQTAIEQATTEANPAASPEEQSATQSLIAENLGNSAVSTIVPLDPTNPAFNVMASSSVQSGPYEDWMSPDRINNLALSLSAQFESAMADMRAQDSRAASTQLHLARVRHILALLQADVQVIGMLKNAPLDFSSPEKYIRSLLFSVRHLQNIGALTPYKALAKDINHMDEETVMDRISNMWEGDVRASRGSGDVFLGDVYGQGDLHPNYYADHNNIIKYARGKLENSPGVGDPISISGIAANIVDGAGDLLRDTGKKLGPEGKVLAAALGTLVAAKYLGPTIASAVARRPGVTIVNPDGSPAVVKATDPIPESGGVSSDKDSAPAMFTPFSDSEGDALVIPANLPYKWLLKGREMARSHEDDEWRLAPIAQGDITDAPPEFMLEGGFFSGITKTIKKGLSGVTKLATKVLDNPIVDMASNFVPVLGGIKGGLALANGLLNPEGEGASESFDAPVAAYGPQPRPVVNYATAPPILQTYGQQGVLNSGTAYAQLPPQQLSFPTTNDKAYANLATQVALKEPAVHKSKELLMTRMFVDDEGKVVGIKDIYKDEFVTGDISISNPSRVISTFLVKTPTFEVPKFDKTEAAPNKRVSMTFLPKEISAEEILALKSDRSLVPGDYSYTAYNPASGDVVPVQTLPGSVEGTAIQLVRVGNAFSSNNSLVTGSELITPAYTPTMEAKTSGRTFSDASQFFTEPDSDSSAMVDDFLNASTIAQGNPGVARAITWLTAKALPLLKKLVPGRAGLISAAEWVKANPKMTAAAATLTYLGIRGSNVHSGEPLHLQGMDSSLSDEESSEVLRLSQISVERLDAIKADPLLIKRFEVRHEVLTMNHNPRTSSWPQIKSLIEENKSLGLEADIKYNEALMIAAALPLKDLTTLGEFQRAETKDKEEVLKHIQAAYLLLAAPGKDADKMNSVRLNIIRRLGKTMPRATLASLMYYLKSTAGQVAKLKPAYVYITDVLLTMGLSSDEIDDAIEESAIALGVASGGIASADGGDEDWSILNQGATKPLPSDMIVTDRGALNEEGIKAAAAAAKLPSDESKIGELSEELMQKVVSFAKSDHFKILAAIVGTSAAVAIIAKLITQGADISKLKAALMNKQETIGIDASDGLPTTSNQKGILLRYQ